MSNLIFLHTNEFLYMKHMYIVNIFVMRAIVLSDYIVYICNRIFEKA